MSLLAHCGIVRDLTEQSQTCLEPTYRKQGVTFVGLTRVLYRLNDFCVLACVFDDKLYSAVVPRPL